MFRRSRFSVRPNVGTVGRGAAAAAPAATAGANQEAGDAPTNAGDAKQEVTSEKAAAAGDAIDASGEGGGASAALQRRKRFSVKPKVAPGRPPAAARTPRTPVRAVPGPAGDASVSGPQETQPTASSPGGSTVAPKGLQSPRRRRPSEGSKAPRVQPKPTALPDDASELSATQDSLEQTQPMADCSGQSEGSTVSRTKELPVVRPPDKVPPSLPDREANEISEKARTLASSKTALSLNASAYSLSRLLNAPSDLQRLVKAQKLRDLLRQERHKEKKMKKARSRVKEYTLDPAKMTMSDLIRYLPTSNPMSCSLEENETVVPSSPARDESPERAREPATPPPVTQEEPPAPPPPQDEDEDEEAANEDEEALMVPQVKVAEDGSLIIDEESLTVEVQRAKGPNPAQDRDPIFERGSTTTYSSFRKGTYTKPWSSEETDMFFLAVSMVGTDFSMICQLFPHRARSEIKNKFKKEERLNSWRIDKAFKERRKLDIEYFSKLLEKIMEVQKNRKKLKSLTEKNAPKKRSRKAAAKKPARKLSSVEEVEEEEEEERGGAEQGEEGEKENEEVRSEGGAAAAAVAAAAAPKNKRKKKESGEEPDDKRSKRGRKDGEEEGGVCESGDGEVTILEDDANPDTTEDVSSAKAPVIKPAKLSRARAPKPTVPLGRKFGKKPAPSTKPKDAALEKEAENADDKTPEDDETNKDATTSSQTGWKKTASDDDTDEDEDAAVRPPKPTRSGRVPKPTKPLTYAAREDSSAPESHAGPAAAAASKPKPKAKRGRSNRQPSPPRPKKPKLVTLRASHTEFSDEDNEGRWDDGEAEARQLACGAGGDDGLDGGAAFVPAGLHALQPEISEVDETMVELDILASMPDVLGISQEALCPDSSFEQTQHDTDTAEPCDHQLDLLVDVIDFLSSEHTEVSEEQSYNEAAQTLLAIGNVAHLPQSAQNREDEADGSEESTSLEKTPTNPSREEESAATSTVSQTPETSQTGTVSETRDQTSDELKTPGQTQPELSSDKSPPPIKKGRQLKVKPKPNLARASRTAQPKSQTSTAEESLAGTSGLPQSDAALPSAGETAQETSNRGPTSLEVEVKLTNEQEAIVDQIQGSATTSDQDSTEIPSRSSSEAAFEPCRDQTSEDANQTSKSAEETFASLFGPVDSDLNEPVIPVTLNSPPVTDSSFAQQSSSSVSLSEETGKKGGSETAALHQSTQTQTEIKPDLSQTSKLEPEEETNSRTEAPTGKGASSGAAPVPKDHDQPANVDAPGEEVPPTQVEGRTASAPQVRRGRLQKIKPILPRTTRAERSKPQTAKEPTGKDSSRSSKMAEAPPTRAPSESPSSEPAPTESPTVTGESCEESVTPEAAAAESQVGRESNDPSSPVQVRGGDSGSSSLSTRVEEAPPSREDAQVPSASQVRRGGFPKVKPKPNIPQTSRTERSKPHTVKEGKEGKDSSLTLKVEAEAQPTNTPSQSQNTEISSADSVDSTKTSEELLRTADKQTCADPPEGPDVSSSGFDGKASGLKNFSGSPLGSVVEEVAGDPRTTSSIADGNLESHDKASAHSVDEALTPDVVVPELPVLSTPQTRRGRTPKAKPNLSLTRAARVRPGAAREPAAPEQLGSTSGAESTDDTAAGVAVQPFCSTPLPQKSRERTGVSDSEPSLRLRSTESEDVGSNSEASQQNVPQRTRRISRVKPNIGPKTAPTNLDLQNPSHKDPTGRTAASRVVELQPVATESTPDSLNAAATSQEGRELEASTGLSEPNTQQVKDPTSDSEPRSVKEEPTEPRSVSSDTSSTFSKRNSSAKSADDSQSEGTDSPATSKKAPQARRGRLVKPKPSLVSRGRPQQLSRPDAGGSRTPESPAGDETASRPRRDARGPAGGGRDPPRGATSDLLSLDPSNTSTERIQTNPVFSEVPADPEEPFFILSLTAIPVPLPPRESPASAGDAAAFNIFTLAQGGAEMGPAHAGRIRTDAATSENPEAPAEEEIAPVDPAKRPATADGDEVTAGSRAAGEGTSRGERAGATESKETRSATVAATPTKARRAQEEEPLGVSQYLLTDIFTEVEED